MPNVLGRDCSEVFPLQRDGNNLFCWQIQTRTALLLVRISPGTVLCSDLPVYFTKSSKSLLPLTVTATTRALCHLPGQRCPPLERASWCHVAHRDFGTAAYEFKPRRNWAGFAFISPYALHQQIKATITGTAILFTLLACSSDDEFLGTRPSLAAVGKARTDWSLGCSYQPCQPPGHLVPEACIMVGVTVGYTPISGVNLNHWQTQSLPPLTRSTWIIPPVSYGRWERSGAPVPNQFGFVKLHICEK